MNKGFKIIWSGAVEGYVAVSESVKSQGKKSKGVVVQKKTGLLALLFTMSIASGSDMSSALTIWQPKENSTHSTEKETRKEKYSPAELEVLKFRLLKAEFLLSKAQEIVNPFIKNIKKFQSRVDNFPRKQEEYGKKSEELNNKGKRLDTLKAQGLEVTFEQNMALSNEYTDLVTDIEAGERDYEEAPGKIDEMKKRKKELFNKYREKIASYVEAKEKYEEALRYNEENSNAQNIQNDNNQLPPCEGAECEEPKSPASSEELNGSECIGPDCPPPPKPEKVKTKVNVEPPKIELSPSAEIYASTRTFLLDSSLHMRMAALKRLQNNVENNNAPEGWIIGQGSWGNYTSAAKLTYQQKGVTAGIDGYAGGWQLGLLGGFTSSTLKANSLDSQASIDTVHAGLYAGKAINNWQIRLGGIYSRHDINVSRKLSYNTAVYKGHTLQLFSEVAYHFGDEGASIEPFINLAHVRTQLPGFVEQGSAASSLSVSKASDKTTYSTVGVRMNKLFNLASNEAVLTGSVGWLHAAGTIQPLAKIEMEKTAFAVSGALVSKNALLINAGLTLKLSKASELEFNYAGTLSKKRKENSLQAKIRVKF